MQNKIDSLQAELQKLQTKNHSNSFADAERLTEVRISYYIQKSSQK